MIARKLIFASMVVLAAAATPARAGADQTCIDECNADFPGSQPQEVSIRGWCYILRGCWKNIDS